LIVPGLSELMDVLAEWAAGAPVTVYVYGSRVRGDHRPDSDVDLYVEYVKGYEAAGDKWYNAQTEQNYSGLREKLPGPISKVMPPFGSRHPFIFNPSEVVRKGNVVALHTPPKPKRKGSPN
jgi:predicted nucleotidyltransferase